MSVVLLVEWDNPKDTARNKKRLDLEEDHMKPHLEKLINEKGIRVKVSSWTDNTGHIIHWYKYETMDEFAIMWLDERWQRILVDHSYYVDNTRIRLLGPQINHPEDLFI